MSRHGKLPPGRQKFQTAVTASSVRSKIRRPIRIVPNEQGWFYKFRAELGVSREIMRQRARVGLNTIEHWETMADREPRLDSLRHIADVFGMELVIEFRPKVLLGGMNGTDEE